MRLGDGVWPERALVLALCFFNFSWFTEPTELGLLGLEDTSILEDARDSKYLGGFKDERESGDADFLFYDITLKKLSPTNKYYRNVPCDCLKVELELEFSEHLEPETFEDDREVVFLPINSTFHLFNK